MKSKQNLPFYGNHTGPYNYSKSHFEEGNGGVAKERNQTIIRPLPQRGKRIPGRKQGAANSYPH
jgi:hypothetical protein